ncbi:MAG: PIN domain-containing protein [Gemmatimonadaceae bacterium]
MLPAGRRRERLAAWLVDDLVSRFEDRILDIDRRVAMHWGVVAARCEAAGVSMATIDVFLAATADVHGMTLVTRNTRDFRRAGISVLDPWRVDDSHV